MTTLWLVRHALPLAPDGQPPSQVCYGHTDWPADATLTRQAAAKLAQTLAAQPHRHHHVVLRCSPLLRCLQLAQALQAVLPASQLTVDSRLAEMHFGEWEGVAWNDIPRHELDAWATDFAHCPVGHSGETVQAFVQRVGRAAHDTLTDLHTLATNAPTLPGMPETKQTTTVWVTHAGVIRAMHWLGRSAQTGQLLRAQAPAQASMWPTSAPGYGQWCHWQPPGEVAA